MTRDSYRRRSVLQSLCALGTAGAAASTRAAGSDEPAASATSSARRPCRRPGGPPPDAKAPSWFGELTGERKTATEATLEWGGPVRDNPTHSAAGFSHYEVVLDGRQVATIESSTDESHTHTFTDLTPGRGYRAIVRAVDGNGNATTKTVVLPAITAEQFTHDCSTLEPLSDRSDADSLRVDATNSQYFPTPEGQPDDARLARSDTTDDVAAAYELPGSVDSLAVQFHKHRSADGWLDVYESSNGEDWSRVETTFETYGGVDADWLHHELTASSFSEAVSVVKLVLTGGTKPWSGQLGHVEIQYFADNSPPLAPSFDEFSKGGFGELGVSWTDQSLSATVDHYNVYVDDELYTRVPAGTTETTIEALEPATTYTVGVSAVDARGGESNRTTADERTHGGVVDDCSDLSTAAFGTDTDRLAVDTTNAGYFERPDGSTDETRITQADTGDADLVYKVSGWPTRITVEFHRHAEYGGELLIDGQGTDAVNPYRDVEQYGDTDGDWIHERHTLANRGPRPSLTIAGGAEPWASQIGHVEITHPPREPIPCTATPGEPRAVVLTESVVQVSWDTAGLYSGLYVDGRKVREAEYDGPRAVTTLTDLEPGTHEIGVSGFSDTHDESEVVTTTVEVPGEPVSRFVDDCSDLTALSPESYLDYLSVDRARYLEIDRSNPSYFRRPDGSSDDGRIVRSRTWDRAGDVVYATPKPVAGVTAEFHTHGAEGGWLEVHESIDGGDSWNPVEASVEAYGSDVGWTHHELGATGVSADATHVKLELTNDDGVARSPQLGHVEIEYDR